MSVLPRVAIKPEFRDGERPSGQDFENLIDSCVNKQDDVSFDNGDLVLSRGVRLGTSTGNVAGGLRFNGSQLEVFTAGAWTAVSGGGGGASFPPVAGSATAVAQDGNVGIGTFPPGPAYRLDVQLGTSGNPADEARFGHAVCANGTGLSFGTWAVFAHEAQATPALLNTNCALRQSSTGEVQVNAALDQPLSLRQGGSNVRLCVVANTGNVIVGSQSVLNGSSAEIFQVNGNAFKTTGGGSFAGGSDARIKEHVRDLELGLFELRQVRPVRFRFNGRAGTPAGQDSVGVIGQEIETILPDTIRRVSVAGDPELDDMRVFDPSSLTYVLINAVKELASRVEQLEEALAAATVSPAPAPTIA